MKEILKNSFTKFLLKILSELNLIEMSRTIQFIYKEITIIQAYVSELLKALKSTSEVKRVMKLPVITGNQNFC